MLGNRQGFVKECISVADEREKWIREAEGVWAKRTLGPRETGKVLRASSERTREQERLSLIFLQAKINAPNE